MTPSSGDGNLGPDCRLVAYGTLRPGEVNDGVLDGLVGTWSPATVRGTLGSWHGYPVLHPDPDGPAIPVMVFESADLPAHWERLDRFEGPAYRRAPVEFTDRHGGGVGTGYVGA